MCLLLQILGHLTLIDHNDHSEVESYLRKVLRTSSDTEMVSTANTRNEQLNGGIENASSAGIPLTTEVGFSTCLDFGLVVHRELTAQGKAVHRCNAKSLAYGSALPK